MLLGCIVRLSLNTIDYPSCFKLLFFQSIKRRILKALKATRKIIESTFNRYLEYF